MLFRACRGLVIAEVAGGTEKVGSGTLKCPIPCVTLGKLPNFFEPLFPYVGVVSVN